MRTFLGMNTSEKYLCQLVLNVDLIIFIPTENLHKHSYISQLTHLVNTTIIYKTDWLNYKLYQNKNNKFINLIIFLFNEDDFFSFIMRGGKFYVVAWRIEG